MQKLLLSSVTALALISGSGAAMAKCNIIDEDFRKTIREDQDLRRQLTGSLMRDARELRNAAATLAAYGKDDACEAVAEAVRELVRDPKAAQQVYLKNGTANRVGGKRPFDDKGWAAYQRDRIAAAQPVNKQLGRLRADEVIGADVENLQGEDLGEVTDILIGHGEKDGYLIVSHGGFLGLGDKQVAIPLDKFKVSEDRDTFYIAMTEEQIEKAPSFKRGQFEWIDDDEWRKKNNAYFRDVGMDSDVKPASGDQAKERAREGKADKKK